MAETEQHIAPATNAATTEATGESSKAVSNPTDASDKTPVVQEVFTLFKSYLEDKLGQKEKQMDSKAQTESKIAQMKFKGNQKQFEHNAQLEAVLDKIKSENTSANEAIDKLVNDGKELIRKRQKLIQIADKSADGWKVVDKQG